MLCLSVGMAVGLIGGQNGEVSVSEELSGEEVGTLQHRAATGDFVVRRGLIFEAHGALPADGYVSESAAGLTRVPLVSPAPLPPLPSPAALPYVEPDIEAIICSFDWPQGCDYWIAVAWCESTLGTDPWAYDVRNPYTGLFQVWSGHGYGFTWLSDDANNTLAAWELSREGTVTSPWPYCRWQ